MAEEKKKKNQSKKWEAYKSEDDKLKKVKKTCIKCGPGVFMAEHKDRYSCGQCGYTIFKNTKSKEKKK